MERYAGLVMRSLVTGVIVVLVVLAVSAGEGQADPITSINLLVRNIGFDLRSSRMEGTGAVGDIVDISSGLDIAIATANAAPGSVGAAVTAVTGEGSFDARAIAGFNLFDLTFAGPGPSTITQLHMEFEGSLDANGPAASSVVQVDIRVEPQGPGVLGGGIGCMDAPRFRHCSSVFPFTLDLSETQNVITTPSFSVPTDEPLILTVSLHTFAQSAFDGGAFASFRNTLSFPTTGSVFALSPGFTVNSIDGRIQDNRWLGVPGRPVPAPPTVSLLSSTMLVLAAVAFRRMARQ